MRPKSNAPGRHAPGQLSDSPNQVLDRQLPMAVRDDDAFHPLLLRACGRDPQRCGSDRKKCSSSQRLGHRPSSDRFPRPYVRRSSSESVKTLRTGHRGTFAAKQPNLKDKGRARGRHCNGALPSRGKLPRSAAVPVSATGHQWAVAALLSRKRCDGLGKKPDIEWTQKSAFM